MSKKWKIDESNLNNELRDFLISNGLAENKFKLNLSAIKNSYKEETPEWVEVVENEYIRVS